MSRRETSFSLATPHAAATEAGEGAFDAGGNALDAALAACATLSVVYPHMCGIGGDLFALVRRPDGGIVCVNGSGAAAGAVDAERLRSTVGSMPSKGPLPITVPGAVGGWETIAGLGARLGLRRALEPAIRYASDGATVSRSLAAALRRLPMAGRDQGLSEIFIRQGRPLALGERFRQPALGRSLEILASQGSESLYAGPLGARLIEGLARRAASLSLADLLAHRSEVTEGIRASYRRWQVLTAPPNSQGFVLLQVLAAVEALGIDPEPWGASAPVVARLFAAASRDRDRYLADPRRTAVPIGDLMSERHIADLCCSATSPAPGSSSAPAAPLRDGPSGDTVAVVTADGEGWAASVIQSLYESFGAGILDPSTGIILHNRGALFSLDPFSPNVIEGGKRPAHTLMPVLVQQEGRLVAIAGTMGGKHQPQIHAQVLIRHLDAGAPAGEAVGAPRWVVASVPPSEEAPGPPEVLLEGGTPSHLIESFRRSGIGVRRLPERDEEFGHAQLLGVSPKGFDVAADPRSDGSAAAR